MNVILLVWYLLIDQCLPYTLECVASIIGLPNVTTIDLPARLTQAESPSERATEQLRAQFAQENTPFPH